MSAEQQYIDLFKQHRQLLESHSVGVLNAQRSKAFADFCAQGFPTTRQERYKYTDAARLFEPDYGMNLNRIDIPADPYQVFKCDVPNMGTSLFFVVNDMFYAGQSPVPPRFANMPDKNLLTSGVFLGSLSEAAKVLPQVLEARYGGLADTSSDGITAFNTAFAQDGLLLYVPRGVVIERPIQLVNVLRSDVDLMVNRRVLIVLEEGASVRLLVCDHTMDDANFLATQVTEAYVGEHATLDLYELEETSRQTTRFSNFYLQQQAGSHVLYNGMTLTNGTTRNTTRVTLSGEGADLNLYGMAIADGQQKVDNNTFVDHAVPHCSSNQLFKYVLDGSAVGAFAGLVLVRPGAHHTKSLQTNRNLCATREAHMYTQPQLEIYNDDVVCNHGSAVGQLDENALFYMRQRGIPLREARLLLMFAFVNEVIDQVRIDALRDRLHYLVEKRFRGELNKGCHNCAICK